MHVFLTGPIQVGKSTLLRRVLDRFPDLQPGGFRTVTRADVPGAMGSVYLIPADAADPEWSEKARVAIRWGPGRGAEGCPPRGGGTPAAGPFRTAYPQGPAELIRTPSQSRRYNEL